MLPIGLVGGFMCTCNWFLIVFCIQPDTGALAFWLFASWGMSSRPNSSNTLLEGMQDVQLDHQNQLLIANASFKCRLRHQKRWCYIHWCSYCKLSGAHICWSSPQFVECSWRAALWAFLYTSKRRRQRPTSSLRPMAIEMLPNVPDEPPVAGFFGCIEEGCQVCWGSQMLPTNSLFSFVFAIAHTHVS